MRMLVLCHEGAPMLASVTQGPLRDRILEWPSVKFPKREKLI